VFCNYDEEDFEQKRDDLAEAVKKRTCTGKRDVFCNYDEEDFE
jgi:hypothetical protein